MAPWLQHTIVLLAVVGSAAAVLRQAFASLRGRKGRIGSCCDKGCGSAPESSSKPAQPPANRIVFLPVEMLTRRRR